MNFLTRGQEYVVWWVDKAAPSVLLGGGPPRKQKHVTTGPALAGRLLHEQQGFNDAGHEGRPNSIGSREFHHHIYKYRYIYSHIIEYHYSRVVAHKI